MLRIEHLTKHYKGNNKGITDLSLHVEPGDLYAFIGHNGSGKTTTLQAIVGIHSFDKGNIYIDGQDITKAPLGCKEKIAYIPDDPSLYDYLTGMQYLNFIADVFHLSNAKRQEQIEYFASAFEITDALNELISTYSHGMKQKLALTGAFLHDPSLLILDEPFVGLDPQAIFTLKGLMKHLCDHGGSVFFSTHVLDVAEKLCNKVAMIKDGHLIIEGRMTDIIKSGQTLESIFLDVDQHA